MLNLTEYPNTGKVRVYDIEAISLPIVYNKFGDYDPNGMLYVLKQDSERIEKKARELFALPVPQPYEEVRPLVIRANVGDTVKINFENRLNRRASIHVQGLSYNVLDSDGTSVGFKPDSTTDHRICYLWQADKEGAYLFSDMACTRSGEQGTNVHGLFGAIIVEAAGSVFLDPKTGEELKSGTKAVIRQADGRAYREFALFIHDFAFLFDREGKPLNPPKHPGSDDDPGVMGINYRCEPMPERLKKKNDPSHIFSSFVYGDPATPVLETYPGEPIRIRLLDGAHEGQHVFNIAGLPWRKEITDPASPLMQSQTIGISEAFNLRIDEPYAAGDYLYYSGGIDDLRLGL